MIHMNLVAIAIACAVLFTGAFIGRQEMEVKSQKNLNKEVQEVTPVVEEPVLGEQFTYEEKTIATPTVSPTTQPSAAFEKNETTTRSQNYTNSTSIRNDVKVSVKDGQQEAVVNGQVVQLDENGCYDYESGGTKIHACAN